MEQEQPKSPPENQSPPEGNENSAAYAWAEKLPPAMKQIALRYGREVFEFSVNIGTVNHVIDLLNRRTQGNQELQQALIVVAKILNWLAKHHMKSHNISARQHLECGIDLAKLDALATPQILVPPSVKRH